MGAFHTGLARDSARILSRAWAEPLVWTNGHVWMEMVVFQKNWFVMDMDIVLMDQTSQ